MTATRAEVRAFGKKIRKGDRFRNRFSEHGSPKGERLIEIVLDVRSTPLFVVKNLANDARPGTVGKTTTMRTRTLLERYTLQ